MKTAGKGTAWAAVQAVARRQLRTGWKGLVVIGLLAGLAGAVATGTMVTQRRTGTAEARLRVAMGVEDLRVTSLGNRLPDTTGTAGITRQWRPAIDVGRWEGVPGLQYLAVISGPPHPGIFTPVVVAGRAVHPASIDEVEVSEVAAASGPVPIHLGDTLRLRFLSAAQADDWNTGIGLPRGPTMSFRVVGLTRITPKSSNGVAIMASPAFYQRFGRALSQGGMLMAQTDDGVAAQSIARALTTRAKANSLQLEYPSRESAPVRTAAHILTGGATSFLAVAALAGIVALVQFSGRHHSAGVPAQRVERILGLTAAERVIGHVAPSLLSAAIAAALAVTGGVAAGLAEPLGSLRTSEPDPGFRLNLAVTVIGGLLTASLVLLASAVTAARATAQRATGRSPRRSLRLARSAVVSAGARLALGGRGAVRLVSGAAAVTLAVAGMLASLSVWASLDHLASTPRYWGQSADLTVSDARPELIDRLQTDGRVRALAYSATGRARIGGRDVTAYSVQHVRGELGWTVLAGQEPADDSQVLLGSRLAAALDVEPGDPVPVETRHGADRLTVSGIGIGPYDGEAFGANALFTPGGLVSAQRSTPYYNLDVELAPGADATAFVASLAQDWEVSTPTPPAEVTSLQALGRLPLYLAAFFVAVGLAALAHAAVLLRNRSRRELAVLHAIGFTRAQTTGSLLVAMLLTTAAGLVIGIPLGLAVGRLVWWQVAAGVGVLPDVRAPLLAAALTAPAALLAAGLLAAVPIGRASRLPLPRALRAE